MKVYVIGDIHGHYDKLKSVLNQIDYDKKEDYIIFLGDLIDRGPKNWMVLKTVYELALNNKHIIVLRGNHEDMLLQYLSKYNLNTAIAYNDIYVYNGGGETLKDLQREYKHNPEMVNNILEWIKTFPQHIVANNIHFSHAGCNPFAKSDKEQDYIWVRGEFFNNYDGKELWFCGHTPIQLLDEFVDVEIDMSNGVKPVKLDNNIICMDTGSYFPNGKVSCMEIISGKVYQSPIT